MKRTVPLTHRPGDGPRTHLDRATRPIAVWASGPTVDDAGTEASGSEIIAEARTLW
jgi:uncharacterized protein YciI